MALYHPVGCVSLVGNCCSEAWELEWSVLRENQLDSNMSSASVPSGEVYVQLFSQTSPPRNLLFLQKCAQMT